MELTTQIFGLLSLCSEGSKQGAKKTGFGQIPWFTILLDLVIHICSLFTCKVIKLYTNPWDARAFEVQTFLPSVFSENYQETAYAWRACSIVQTGIYQSANSVISNSPLSKHHSSFYRLGRHFMFPGAGSEILWGMFSTCHPAKSNRQVMLTFYSPPDCVPKPRPGNRRFAAFNGRKVQLLEANVWVNKHSY